MIPGGSPLLLALLVALLGIQEHIVRIFEPHFALPMDAGPVGCPLLLEIACFRGHLEARLCTS
jgi:hypothetical protein